MMKIQSSIIIVLLLLSVTACRNHDTNPQLESGAATVKVNISGAEFEETNEINPLSLNGESQAMQKVQRQEVKFNEDLFLMAELVPVVRQESKSINTASSGILPFANTKTSTTLPAGIKYKVVVYKKSDGSYVDEQVFTRGSEAQASGFRLNGGVTYTFVAYSVNTNKETDLPAITFTDPNNKTLETSNLKDVNSNLDFMYHKQDFIPSGEVGADNRLDILFKHKFSQITTVLNTSTIGYRVSSITAGFDSHYPTADIKLSTADITNKGTAGNTPTLVFSGLNTETATANTILLGSSTITGKLTISTITINGITKSNVSFSGIKTTPGVKYNLNLNFTSADKNSTLNGQEVAIIGGKTWMRYNTGATGSTDTPSQTSIGNYHLWGRSHVVATGTTSSNGIIGWQESTTTNTAAWNSGTEAIPKRTTADPCPTGFRVPTVTEFNKLVADTDLTNIGSWGTDNFTAAKVFKSKRNANVKLTFPAAGYRNKIDGSLKERSVTGYYWVSSAPTPGAGRNFQISSSKAVEGTADSAGFGESVRCVAE